MADVRASVVARLPERPSCPQLPDMAPYRAYLPSMPSCPSVPLPEPVAKTCQFVTNVEELISPLMRPLNRIIIVLSVSSAVAGDRLLNYLALRPANILGSEVQIPYVWTLVTSVLVEPNPLFMVLHLGAMNYVVACNRHTFESAWRTNDFYMLIAIGGALASLTHFGVRLSLRAITQDEAAYADSSYASINFIVMALLMGLRQQARPNFAALPLEDSAVVGAPTRIEFNRDPFAEEE